MLQPHRSPPVLNLASGHPIMGSRERTPLCAEDHYIGIIWEEILRLSNLSCFILWETGELCARRHTKPNRKKRLKARRDLFPLIIPKVEPRASSPATRPSTGMYTRCRAAGGECGIPRVGRVEYTQGGRVVHHGGYGGYASSLLYGGYASSLLYVGSPAVCGLSCRMWALLPYVGARCRMWEPGAVCGPWVPYVGHGCRMWAMGGPE